MRLSVYVLSIFSISVLSCNSSSTVEEPRTLTESAKQLPYFTYDKKNVYPGDSALQRAEDGIAFEDGHLLVADQKSGLRKIEKDGKSRPFGKFKEAGFVYDPQQPNSPNGMALEHDGKHLLISDLEDGKIYRVNLTTEDVEVAYDHPYGVNSVYIDKKGAIWFTQSAQSTNVKELVSELNHPVPHGAIFRMADLKTAPVKVADSLYFANGLIMDREEKHLFVSETMMDRVKVFDVDIDKGTAEFNQISVSVISPDNLLIDPDGRLFVAATFINQVIAVDFKNHSQHIIFDGSTKENLKGTNELIRRNHLGVERFNPRLGGLANPLPGAITGMFFSKDYRTFYISNLGRDLLKFDYQVQ